MTKPLLSDARADDSLPSAGEVFKIHVRRLIAFAIDVVVISTALWLPILWLVFGGHLGPNDGNMIAAILIPVVFAYEVVMLRIWGATVGKLAVRCRVRSRNGEHLTWLKASMRTILLAASIAFWPLAVVGLIASFFGKRKQLPHDRLIGTKVSVIPPSPIGRRVSRTVAGACVAFIAQGLLLSLIVEWAPNRHLGYQALGTIGVLTVVASSTLFALLIARRDAGVAVLIGCTIPWVGAGIAQAATGREYAGMVFVAMALAAGLVAAHLGRRFFKTAAA